VRNLASRLFESALHNADANRFVIMQLELLDRSEATEQGSAAAGNDAFFDRSAVACMASSTRAFFSFSSVSVAAPTLMTATPPTNLARRSWSFSLS